MPARGTTITAAATAALTGSISSTVGYEQQPLSDLVVVQEARPGPEPSWDGNRANNADFECTEA
jgi:hypothetical protein